MTENHDPVVVEPATPESGGECPVAHGGLTPPTMGDANHDWWPNKLNLKILAKNPAVANPLGERVQLRRGVQDPRPRGREAGHRGSADHLAGLVAG